MRQLQALQVMLSGQSAFLTGAPGAGKTYVLNEFIQRARGRGLTVAVTASTGIAATHIGGTTIHSWSGLGIRDSLSEHDQVWLASNDKLRKRYLSTDVLVIDEVSMLHGARLDMVNQAAKLLRGSNEPFGGLQVILVGDLFQLPPVSPGREIFDFAHLSLAWQELAPVICYLTEQHRQTSDDPLLQLLSAMRSGDFDQMHLELLESRRAAAPHGQAVTKLYTHNIDVDSINQRHLRALPAESHSYQMATHGAKAKVEQLVKSVLAPAELTLKIGAEVMFVANDFAAGYVNGSRGVVVGFNGGYPVVELRSGKEIAVAMHTWSLSEDGKIRAEVSQLPLRLAWAITVHKSQGMSLDAAEIDLSRAFTPGMGYVALSRLRGLDGLFLQGWNQQALQLHPDMYGFDRQLRQLSAEQAAHTSDAEPEKPAAAAVHDEDLFQKLRTWRAEQAKNQHVAAYMVLHDTSLQEIARRKPVDINVLMAIKGFGPKKVDLYSASILTLVREHVDN